MAIDDEHQVPLGSGFPGWDGHPVRLKLIEREVRGIRYLSVKPQTAGGSHLEITAMTLEDAEALCYLLYDLTQPLRDARDKK